VTARSNRSCRLCWVCLIKKKWLPFVRLYSKRSRLSSHLHSDGHWSCMCVCEYRCSHDVTLRLMSARVHPSRWEKLPEESSLNTLWCRKLSHPSHAAQTVFQVPNI